MATGISRELICIRATRELEEGMYVNLGVGLPTQVSNFLPPDKEIVLHSENGLLGYGPIADEEIADIDLLNAAAQPVTVLPGMSCFDTAEAFMMIRGGHIDLAILGAFQVSEHGDLANFMGMGEPLPTYGGGVDICRGAKRVIILMEHTAPDGKSRLVKECTYPVTGYGVVDRVITNLAVIDVTSEGLVLRELAPDVTVEEVQAASEAKLIIPPDIKVMEF